MTESAGSANADASSLCTSCGMCCDGTLFVSAVLEPEERPRVRLPLVNGVSMPQPCDHLSSSGCGIYEDRFSVCRSYRCSLLQALDKGAIDLEAAHGKVRRALALRADLDTALPPGKGVVWDRAAKALSAPRDAAAGTWMMAAAVLRVALARDFADPMGYPIDELTPRQ